MNKFTYALTLVTTGVLFSCSSNETPENVIETDPNPASDLCQCLDSTFGGDKSLCDSLFPVPTTNEEKTARIDAAALCGIELTFTMDTILSLDSLPEPESIDDVLTMEVPDPLSEECQTFLEEYAEAIERYTSLLKKMDKNPDDIGLLIKHDEMKGEFKEWPSKPQMFQCSSNESFKHKVEKLTEQADKLLEQ